MTNGKVLVIEDNKLNMKLVRDLLKIGKYQVFEAEDAETGIELAQVHKPDLILMDIQLPGINGLDATKILREKTNFSSIPIIALTGCAMRGDKKKALDAGCVGYITKPIDTRAFLEKIAQFLNGNPKSTE
jgi:CheY-like chemotaxis protein